VPCGGGRGAGAALGVRGSAVGAAAGVGGGRGGAVVVSRLSGTEPI